jgi:hypothetical protein
MKHVWVMLALVACGENTRTDDVGTEVEVSPDAFAPEVCNDPTCEEQVRCPGGCAKLDGPCMRGVCGALGCAQIPLSGQQCDDGRDCTDDDRCALGMCVGDTSRCEGGVACGEVFCPGADAVCVDGHCERCSMALEDSDCEPPVYPRLVCPNMPAGERVVARLGGRIRDTGPVYYPEFALSWTDSTWGDTASGWCDIYASWPPGCDQSMGTGDVNWPPGLSLQRLTFSDEAIGAYVVVRTMSATPLPELHNALCDGPRIAGAVLSIEVER